MLYATCARHSCVCFCWKEPVMRRKHTVLSAPLFWKRFNKGVKILFNDYFKKLSQSFLNLRKTVIINKTGDGIGNGFLSEWCMSWRFGFDVSERPLSRLLLVLLWTGWLTVTSHPLYRVDAQDVKALSHDGGCGLTKQHPPHIDFDHLTWGEKDRKNITT